MINFVKFYIFQFDTQRIISSRTAHRSFEMNWLISIVPHNVLFHQYYRVVQRTNLNILPIFLQLGKCIHPVLQDHSRLSNRYVQDVDGNLSLAIVFGSLDPAEILRVGDTRCSPETSWCAAIVLYSRIYLRCAQACLRQLENNLNIIYLQIEIFILYFTCSINGFSCHRVNPA